MKVDNEVSIVGNMEDVVVWSGIGESGSRVSIAAKLVADMLVAAGADRVITMDLHADQIRLCGRGWSW